VLSSDGLAHALRRLHLALTGPASPLECSERLGAAIAVAVRAAQSPLPEPPRAALSGPETARTARRVRDYLEGSYAAEVTGADLADVAGRSRYAAYRAFRAVHGLAPSEYQRLLRLRFARQCLAGGMAPAAAAAAAGFADQAHLTRWFRRCYGITPAAFVRAAPGR
jgi:AraC-like DNA-binding protein